MKWDGASFPNRSGFRCYRALTGRFLLGSFRQSYYSGFERFWTVWSAGSSFLKPTVRRLAAPFAGLSMPLSVYLQRVFSVSPVAFRICAMIKN